MVYQSSSLPALKPPYIFTENKNDFLHTTDPILGKKSVQLLDAALPFYFC